MTAIRVSAIIATDISAAITIPIGQVFDHLTISAVLVTYFYFIPLKYFYQLFLSAFPSKYSVLTLVPTLFVIIMDQLFLSIFEIMPYRLLLQVLLCQLFLQAILYQLFLHSFQPIYYITTMPFFTLSDSLLLSPFQCCIKY